MKAMNSVRKYRNEDGAASKCSAGSFVPRSRAATGGTTEDRAASTAPPPRSDAQKSRDASEPLFKKKSSTRKEHSRREPSPTLDGDDSSNVEEDDGSSSEDADGYDRDRRQYNEDRRRWQENVHHNPPGDGGGDDPEEPPGGGGGGAGQGDRGPPQPPPRGDGDQPRGQPRQAGIIDGEVLSALAKRFKKPSRPPPPPIPTFKDSYKDYPRFRADLRAYLKEFYSTAPERVWVMTIREKCFTKATLAKIGHLDTVKEIFATLSETYVRTDRYLKEILVPIRKMRPVDENDHVGLETFYVHILALCTEAHCKSSSFQFQL